MKRYKRKFDETIQGLMFIILNSDHKGVNQVEKVLSNMEVKYKKNTIFKDTAIDIEEVSTDILQKLRNTSWVNSVKTIEKG